jgi:hypothetical protein
MPQGSPRSNWPTRSPPNAEEPGRFRAGFSPPGRAKSTFSAHRGLPSIAECVDERGGVFNFDMVGRLRGQATLQGIGSSPVWTELIETERGGRLSRRCRGSTDRYDGVVSQGVPCWRSSPAATTIIIARPINTTLNYEDASASPDWRRDSARSESRTAA